MRGASTIQFLHLPEGAKLSSKLVNTIYQDDDGFIYFGTASGLDRFDGYSVRSYVCDPADTTTIHDSYVEYIVAAPDGRLWIGGASGFSVFDPATDRFHRNSGADYSALGLSSAPQLVAFDSAGNGWFYVRDDGIYIRNGGVTRRVSDPDGLLRRGEVCELAEDSSGRMCAALRGGDIVFIEPQTARPVSVVRPTGETKPQPDHIFHLYHDRDGLLWVFSEGGLWLYSPASGTWHDSLGGTPLPQGLVKSVIQDRMGRMWIGFEHDGIIVMEKNGVMQHLNNDSGDYRSLGANTVTSIMEDRSGTVWVGSRKNGVSRYDETAFKFDFTGFPDVNCILPGVDGKVWLATDSDGIILWDRRSGRRHNVTIPGCNGPDATVVTLAGDSTGTMWAGTYALGLIRTGADGSGTRRYTTADGLVSDNIWSILPLSDGSLMLGTLGAGLQVYNPATGASKVYDSQNSGLGNDFVISMSRARDGRVWLSTAYGVAVYDPRTDDIVTMRGNRRGDAHFLNDNVNQVYADSRGLIWLATRTGLNVYDPDTDSVYVVPTGPPGRFVLGIAEDAAHAMWTSIGNSLTSIAVDGGDGKPWTFTTHTYDSSDGLQTCDFNQRSIASLPDGGMMIGGFYGVNEWRPDAIKPGQTAPRVMFTGLSLYNEEVAVGASNRGRVLLPRRISDLDRIVLDHTDNEFSISFTTDNYVKPERTVYSYRLDGFNEEWQQLPPNTHRVSYTNLAPGHYRLHVRAVSGDGVPSANEAALDIVIRPPFYATPIAKALFFVLLALSIIGSVWLVHRRDQRISQMRIREEARRKQEELDDMKFRFFTNVSHELRTPLTLITAPLDSLMKQKFDSSVHEKLDIIHTNADKLLAMVNQLLDFRKSEMAALSLNLSRGNIVAFVRDICDNFKSLGEKKNIHLTFFSPLHSLNMDFDEDKMGKIVTNLLSNAFKFTPAEGRVDVAMTLAPEGDMLEITIADTGCGISDADKQRVFERFFQSADAPSVGGTGIGLNLVAEFARLHGGSVAVADNAVRGTVFTVTIPVRGADSVSSADDTLTRPAGSADAPPAALHGGRRLLVVDDNADLQRFVASELNGDYTVVTASDGAEAIQEIKRVKPDIIISDLMMEGMDGIELCRRLKGSPDTADIPLLILTAKHDVSAKIEGLTLGADDYMTKPFNVDELRLRLSKLLDLRGRGAKRALIDPEPQDITITSLDEKLIERAVRYVDANMARADLSVEELAAELGMSRVHLYKRLKQITGKTPIEFIRLLRLKRAAQLLRESQLNISEIAYDCGFNNPKYFSRYFKEEFGVLPSVYQNREDAAQ